MTENITTGVFGSSLKDKERRLPIHPAHIAHIPDIYRRRLYFEVGYGERLGVSDKEIQRLNIGVLDRDDLFTRCNLLLLPKPTVKDLTKCQPYTAVCGWMHCVQQRDIVQTAIDQRLTLIAWENMHVGPSWGQCSHVFWRNNELAGYCAVLHALQEAGIAGAYGPSRKATVISFGCVSRGAVAGLQAMGISDITVFTRRQPGSIVGKIAAGEYGHLRRTNGKVLGCVANQAYRPFCEVLAESDVIVNGILQDAENPWMFIDASDVSRLKRGTLIIDISCDTGMGFPFARPTTFRKPISRVEQLNYYAVDHAPSFLWDAATWVISEALLPWLPHLLNGPASWKRNESIAKAIEICNGNVVNPLIMRFQKRSIEYPHSAVC